MVCSCITAIIVFVVLIIVTPIVCDAIEKKNRNKEVICTITGRHCVNTQLGTHISCDDCPYCEKDENEMNKKVGY